MKVNNCALGDYDNGNIRRYESASEKIRYYRRKIGPRRCDVFRSHHCQNNTWYNEFKYLVVRGLINNMRDKTVLRVLD
jgi:hypothetical protein